MRAILHPLSSSSSNTTEDNDACIVVLLPSTLPRYQRTPGELQGTTTSVIVVPLPLLPCLYPLPLPPFCPTLPLSPFCWFYQR